MKPADGTWYPKQASLWWTSTYDAEEKADMIFGTTAGCHKFLFEEKFKILGNAMNRQGKRTMLEENECSRQTRPSGRTF